MRFCTSCGSKVADTQAFCVGCGTPLAAEASAATTATGPGEAAWPSSASEAAPTAVLPTAGVELNKAPAPPPPAAWAPTAPPPPAPWTSAPPPPPPPPPPAAPWAQADQGGYDPPGTGPWDGNARPRRSSKTPLLIAALVLFLVAVGGGVYLLTRPDKTTTATSNTGTAASTSPSGPATPSDSPSASSATTSPPVTDTGPARDLTSTATAAAASQAPAGLDAGNNTVTYTPSNMVDGVPSTAWRTRGDASGQILTFSLPDSSQVTTVGLVNGYSKTDPTSGENRYRQERRITAVTWLFDDGTTTRQDLTDGDTAVQSVDLPAPGARSRTVRLRIDSTTTPGDFNFDYTAISDVLISGS